MSPHTKNELLAALKIIQDNKSELLNKNSLITDEDLKTTCINVATILGMFVSVNCMHHYKYREVKQQEILSKYIHNTSHSPHGVVSIQNPSSECKTITAQTNYII